MSETRHGIERGFYTNGPYGTRPVLECRCGFQTSPGNENWQCAGEELDEHIDAAKAEACNAD